MKTSVKRIIKAGLNPIVIRPTETTALVRGHREALKSLIYVECEDTLQAKINESITNGYHLSDEMTSEIAKMLYQSRNLSKMDHLCDYIEGIYDRALCLSR